MKSKCKNFFLLCSIVYFSFFSLRIVNSQNSWQKPENWIATKENGRKPLTAFYEENKNIPIHDQTNLDDLGLKWDFPLKEEDLKGLKMIDLGGVFCPTLAGRTKGNFSDRYRGIHRGHDLGVPISKLGDRKIPVRVIADGIYDGQRIYEHAPALPLDCQPLMVYHFNNNKSKVYTSLYCHVVPREGLVVGQSLKMGDIIGYLEDPKGGWSAHVHLELYTRPVYISKDSTKFSRCGCFSNTECDNKARKEKQIPRGCGIFEDDLYIVEPLQFIKEKRGGER